MSVTLMRTHSALAGLICITGCYPVLAHPTRVESGFSLTNVVGNQPLAEGPCFFARSGPPMRTLVMLGASLSFTLMTPYRPDRR